MSDVATRLFDIWPWRPSGAMSSPGTRCLRGLPPPLACSG